jgi:DNA-binding MarR family transcriptional regulator
MAALYHRGPLSVVQLARTERVTHPTMSRIVAGLTRMDVASTSPDPHDGRSRRVELTSSGRRLYEQVSERRIAMTEAVVRQLKPQTVEDLLDAIRRVAADN